MRTGSDPNFTVHSRRYSYMLGDELTTDLGYEKLTTTATQTSGRGGQGLPPSDMHTRART